jgi:hypothetical protein
MKSNSQRFIFLCCGLLASANAFAAVLVSGYTAGAGSQLLTGNGGAGALLFTDSGIAGGENDLDGAFPALQAGILSGSGLWNIGDTVAITGVALVLRGNTTSGDFTFDIREAVGGSGTTGAGGLSSLGTAEANFTDQDNGVFYVNFDTPVSFVADANSTSIGISWTTTSTTLGFKAWNNNSPGDRLERYNINNGNVPGGNAKWIAMSVAGSVTPVPEPSHFAAIAGLLALGVIAMRRRK